MMRYIVPFVLAVVSFISSRLLLLAASPNDPEGTNLLITTIAALVIFASLWAVYRLILKKRKANR